MTLLESAPSLPRNTDTMRAAVVASPGRVETVEAPVPQPAADQIRVKLQGCGVCASNVPPFEGREWFKYPMGPGHLGHEGWGIVNALGENVRAFSVGERVAIISNNAYAEYDIADQGSAVKLPPALAGVPFPAEPLGCAINIFRRSNICQGQTVAILGIGFLGALLTQLATNVGVRVVAISRRPFSLEYAKQFGAEHVTLMDDHHRVINEMRELTGGAFCDIVIECTGKEWPLNLAAEVTRERGRMVVAGYHQDGLRSVNMQLWNWRGLDVICAHERDPAMYLSGMNLAAKAVANGRLNPAPLYTHVLPLEQLGHALELTRDRPDGFMKALITM
ncbi:MAG: MDR/zinc-dependent alcohol dehydrogenase-like family protein [Phycisphaerae bacterium]